MQYDLITDEQLMYFQNILEQVNDSYESKVRHYWKLEKDNRYGEKIVDSSEVNHSNVFGIKSVIQISSGGNCWGKNASMESVEVVTNLQNEFFLDKLIKSHFNEISLKDYMEIANNYVNDTLRINEYYGNYEVFQIIEVNTKDVLQKLQDVGCDVSVSKLESLINYYKKDEKVVSKKKF